MGANRRLISRVAAAAFMWVAVSAPALAQKPDDEVPLPPYDVQGLQHSKIWVPWIFAFVFAAGCIAVGIKNPHRSHLD